MLEPPMRNFGVPGLAKWAELLTAGRDPKSWPRMLDAPGHQCQLLTWLCDWVETAGTGGGFFRAMYAEFLEQAAGPLERPELAGLAGDITDPQPLDAGALSALPADLRRRVLDLAEAEEAAAAALREEQR
jgi:hypothetical protein